MLSPNALQDHTNLILRLHQTLASCSQSVEAEDFSRLEQSISELGDFLNSIAELALENEADETTSFEILTEIHRYLSSSSLDQAVIDALSFELPKAVAKFACVSKRCLEVSGLVIDQFVEVCSPRDMLSVLCGALGSPSEKFRVPDYFSCLLSATSKVLVSIRRRHFQQVNASLPVILNILKAMALESDDEDTDCEDLFYRTIGIANSIQEICAKLEGEESKRTRALFGLFILQTMALVTIGMRNKVSSCLPLVLQLTHFLRHCNPSYIGLVTGQDVDMMTNSVLRDDGDDHMSCFSHVKHGSILAVIWGYKSNEVAVAAEVDFATVKDELQRDQTKRWQAIGEMKHIFSSVNIPWDLKRDTISFLLTIMHQNASLKSQDECHDYSIYMPSHYASLQAIEMLIMYAPDTGLRKNAFEAFRRVTDELKIFELEELLASAVRTEVSFDAFVDHMTASWSFTDILGSVLADIPPFPRFDILSALVKSSDSSSMIAILLNCIKEEMFAENGKGVSSKILQEENEAAWGKTFWNTATLELLQLVLRPPRGGPPDLPEHSDAVLSALNLYRFILITETTGKTNYTRVASKDMLQKAYNEWLLPLRTLVTGIKAENQKDCDQLANDTICALNPIELVLYRCIELVEENLKSIG